MRAIPFASFIARPEGRFVRRAAAILSLLLLAPLAGPPPALAQSQQQAQPTISTEDFTGGNNGLTRVLTYIRQGGDPNVVLDGDGNTFMHYVAALSLSYEVSSIILAETLARGGDCDARNSHGGTPLHIAASRDDSFQGVETRIVRPLIACGNSSNAKDSYGNTPLHAVYEGAAGNSGKHLLQFTGSLLTLDDEHNKSVGTRRFYQGGAELPIARILLGAGVDPNARDTHGGTPLMMAIRHGFMGGADNLEHVRLLLRYRADPNARDPEHGSLLIATLKQNHLDSPRYTVPVLTALLRAGADPDARDRNGETPLIHATKYGKFSLADEIETLLNAGADPCIADREGKFPVQHAKDRGNQKSARLLREAGGAIDLNTGRCGHVADASAEKENASGGSASEPRTASSPPAPTPVCTEHAGGACWIEISNQPGCYLWNPYPEQNETVTFSGACTEGKASGRGDVEWRYTWNGMRQTENSTGEYRDGKPHGRWKIRHSDGNVKYACFNNGVGLGEVSRWQRCP